MIFWWCFWFIFLEFLSENWWFSKDYYCVTLAGAAAANEHAKYTKKMINFQTKNPRKMNQNPHQKINNFYYIYKSPRAMLVTSENTWNDV